MHVAAEGDCMLINSLGVSVTALGVVLVNWWRTTSVPHRLASLWNYRWRGWKLWDSTGLLLSCLQEIRSFRWIWPRSSQCSAKNYDGTRRNQPKKSFFTIPRTRICSTKFYAVISFYTTYPGTNSKAKLCHYLCRGRCHPLQAFRIVVKIEINK